MLLSLFSKSKLTSNLLEDKVTEAEISLTETTFQSVQQNSHLLLQII